MKALQLHHWFGTRLVALILARLASQLASSASVAVRSRASLSMSAYGRSRGSASHSGRHLGPRPTMMCFTTVCPGTNDKELVQTQLDLGDGIGSCDVSAVFSNESIEGLKGVTVLPILTGTMDVGGENLSLLYKPIYRYLVKERFYKDVNWLIKLDPDTVWSAEHFRDRLSGSPSSEPMYYFNDGPGSFHGGFEVLTPHALEVYYQKGESCENAGLHMPEDWFLDDCFRHLGVRAKTRNDLFKNYIYDASACADTNKIAFHMFKQVDSWKNCWQQMKSALRGGKESLLPPLAPLTP